MGEDRRRIHRLVWKDDDRARDGAAVYQCRYGYDVETRFGRRTFEAAMKNTSMILRPASALALAVFALVVCVPTIEARGGKDDPAGQKAGDNRKNGRGGADDPANHDLGDDRGGRGGSDDPVGDDRGGANKQGGSGRGGLDDPAGDDHGGSRTGGGSGRGGLDDPADHDRGDDRGGDTNRGGRGRGGNDDPVGHT